MVRLKHRYLVVHILYPSSPPPATKPSVPALPTLLHLHAPTPQSVDIPHLLRLIKHSVQYMYGDYGLGLILPSLKIMYLSPATSTAIIRVARSQFRTVWAGLTWMTELGKSGNGEGEACVFRVVRVCGTVVKAEEEVVRRAREEIRRARKHDGVGLAMSSFRADGKSKGEGEGEGRESGRIFVNDEDEDEDSGEPIDREDEEDEEDGMDEESEKGRIGVRYTQFSNRVGDEDREPTSNAADG